ncbi:hypothetical protein I3271_05700 [Photobacterium leiognathi]|uniref:anthrax toxin lethal factor-related metalloendopeptidase n=1 Tax=Photobacterium leiognathi TaxID=553611 RepID=UPI001EDE452B|nr:hypothetical protein [Photobacterium leiognathi]MCG3884176.1 hypothetical protein [Photobacterium leiognathi]
MQNNKLFYLTAISDEIENYNARKGVLDKLLVLNKITKAIDDYFSHSNELRKKQYETLSAKFAFTPSGNKEMAASNLVSSNITEHVSYRKNSNVDAINTFGDCASRVYSRFNITRAVSQFGVKGAPNERKGALRFTCKAIASYASVMQRRGDTGLPSVDEIAFNNVKCTNDYVKKMEDTRKAKVEHYKSNMLSSIERRINVVQEVKDLAHKVENYGYTIGNSLKDIFTHELGHMVDRHNVNKTRDIKRLGYSQGWGYLLSQYATSSDSEYFAEAFCLYVNYPDQHWRLEPTLLALLKKMDLSKNETY